MTHLGVSHCILDMQCVYTRGVVKPSCILDASFFFFLEETIEIFALVMQRVKLEQVKHCVKFIQHGSLLRRKGK